MALFESATSASASADDSSDKGLQQEEEALQTTSWIPGRHSNKQERKSQPLATERCSLRSLFLKEGLLHHAPKLYTQRCPQDIRKTFLKPCLSTSDTAWSISNRFPKNYCSISFIPLIILSLPSNTCPFIYPVVYSSETLRLVLSIITDLARDAHRTRRNKLSTFSRPNRTPSHNWPGLLSSSRYLIPLPHWNFQHKSPSHLHQLRPRLYLSLLA